MLGFSCSFLRVETNKTSDIEHIWQLSWRGGFYRGGPVLMSALAGVDIALWDLKGMQTLFDNNLHLERIGPDVF